MWLAGAAAVVFVIVVAATMLVAPTIIAVSVAVMVYHAVQSPVFHWWTMRGRTPGGSFVRETGPPFAAGLAGFIPAMLLTRSMPPTRWGDAISIVVAGGLFTAIYALALYFLAPKSVHDFWQQLAPYLHRIWPSRARAG
jgi:hypothetical protein